MASHRKMDQSSCWLIWMFILCWHLLLVSSDDCRPPQALPDVDDTTYHQIGDINIGVFLTATSSAGSNTCLKSINSGSSVIEHSEAIAYAVKLVNDNPNLLPNITLGFIQVNDCGNDNVALATALSFLPRLNYQHNGEYVCSDNSSASSLFFEKTANDDIKCTQMPFYDVIGVIGPTTSTRSLPISKLFASARIPIIGCLATSDELSDKYRHPYYLRVIPPDKYQVDATLQFIQSNAWSYISVIYFKESYGQRAFDHIKEIAPDYQICIATSHRIDETSNFDVIVKDLISFKRSRVVILYINTQSSISLLDSAQNFNASDLFIWIWSDSWNTAFKKMPYEVQQNVIGSLSVGLNSAYAPEFWKYLRQIKVYNTTNPWFKLQWENLSGCKLNSNESCDLDFDVVTSTKFGFEKTSSLYIDAVFAFANAIHNLILHNCPEVSGSEVRACINGEMLLSYLRNVSFHGYNGQIQFDEFGDRKGKYEIRQILYDYRIIPTINTSSTPSLEAKTVAVYDVGTNYLNFTGLQINWDYVVHVDRILPDTVDERLMKIPESVCSRPCVPGEFKIQRDPVCCWDCRTCRDNEKVTSEDMDCEACDLLTWPDKSTGFQSCILIPPTYPLVTDTIPVILICLATAALLCASLVAIGYIQFRESRVIKAASRELSITQMGAIFVGYVTVIIFQTQPTHAICGTLYFLFCLSFALIYAPLLVKTIRIFRIFQSGKMQNKRPRLISPSSQLVIAGILITVQMLLCLLVYIIYVPTAVSTQPVPTEKYVELSCDMTSPGLTSFLGYNLVLVFLCSIFAFKTRKLPDNFNESKFISMCVSTTLVIWLAFVPTYFTASRSSARIMLLSVALLLNHSVALGFLFVPKIYAAAYLPTENFVISRFQSGTATADVVKQGCSNRVSPSISSNSLSPRKRVLK